MNPVVSKWLDYLRNPGPKKLVIRGPMDQELLDFCTKHATDEYTDDEMADLLQAVYVENVLE